MSRGKYQKKREPVVNIAICMAIVLFWLVIITTNMSAGLFARYTTSDSGSDSARVIQFNRLTVKETTENSPTGTFGEAFYFMPGYNLKKDIAVEFGGSEADTYVLIAVDVRGWDLTDKAASKHAFSLTQGTKTVMNWSVVSNWQYVTDETVTFADGGKGTRYVYCIPLETNESLPTQQVIQGKTPETEGEYTPGMIFVRKDCFRADYKALSGMKIDLNVTAYAVQANGFADAAAAWASLSAKEVQP